MNKKKSTFEWQELKKMIFYSALISILVTLLFNPRSLYSLPDALLQFSVSFMVSIVLWMGLGSISDFLDERISWLENPKKRFVYGVISLTSYAGLVFFILNGYFHIYHRGLSLSLVFSRDFLFSMFVSLLIAAVVALSLYSAQFLGNWRTAFQEQEQMKRDQINMELAALKSQLNPHFLFNSLNTLEALVYKNQDDASKFIHQLSKIYRYVLDKQKEELVPLKGELDFAQSYIYLQQIRFGKNLDVNFNVNHSDEDLIPPISLQMILENAIKHNEISKEKLLTIDVYLENDLLVVKNNLQVKGLEETSGVGLENIKSRYAFFTDQKVEVNKTISDFIVKIPVLKLSEISF